MEDEPSACHAGTSAAGAGTSAAGAGTSAAGAGTSAVGGLRPWFISPADTAAEALLAQTLECTPFVARLLMLRGVGDADAARRFFSPTIDDLADPMLLLGIEAAVERIERAVRAREPILIYGDYDVDGTTATVLLKTAIERIARTLTPNEPPPRVDFHVPHRLREGYGMRGEVLGEAARHGIRLVISVDTGIRAFAAAAEARALTLDLLVTDHHLPDDAAGLPAAHAVINPAQTGCPYPNKSLCGAGVVFKLVHALLRAQAKTPEQQETLRAVLLPSLLKLVAIATIADAVPLTGENRTIAVLGLRALARPVQPGLRALMEIADLPLDRTPTAVEIGFRLAPRINAAGRMDVASDVVELFLTRDPARAAELAGKLDRLNEERRATEAGALTAIDQQLGALVDPEGNYPPECIVLDHPEWHRGVIGILASRVVERTGRPALVMSHENDVLHGSGRSVEGYHLLEALTSVHAAGAAESTSPGTPVLFTRFGGHAHAVGFSLPRAHAPQLRAGLAAHSRSGLTRAVLAPPLVCDLEVAGAELTFALLRDIERFAPFGAGHCEPVLLARGLRMTGPARIIKHRHVCLPLEVRAGERPVSAMGWSRSGQTLWPERVLALGLGTDVRVDAVFYLRENTHQTFAGLELSLLDLARSA